MTNAKHVQTDSCGFDRNGSHSAGHYVCTCGWEGGMADAKPVEVGALTFEQWWGLEFGDEDFKDCRNECAMAWKQSALALQAEVVRLTQENARLAGEVAAIDENLKSVKG